MATKLSGCGCFACGSSQVVRVDKSRRYFEDQNLFKLADQFGEKGLPRASSTKDRDPCAQCLRDVKEVWELNQEIQMIQRDIKDILQKITARRGRGQGQGGRGSLRRGVSSSGNVKDPVPKKRRKEEEEDPNGPDSGDDDAFTVRIKEEIEIDPLQDDSDPDLEDTILGISSPEDVSRDSEEGSNNADGNIDPDPDYSPEEGALPLNRTRRQAPSTPLVPLLGRNVVISKTRSGKEMVVVDGYNFRINRPGANKLIWKCCHPDKEKCSARIHTTPDLKNIQLLDEIGLPHNHPPPVDTTLAFRDLKERIISEVLSTPENSEKGGRKVFQKYSEELKVAVKETGFPNLVENLKRSITRRKKSMKGNENEASPFMETTRTTTNSNESGNYENFSEFV